LGGTAVNGPDQKLLYIINGKLASLT
jgi:hypothetical protein